jgi:hypothetical protein
MLASLIAVHGGAIYGISGLRNVAPASQSDFLIWGAAFNLAGLFLTLVSGLFAENIVRPVGKPCHSLSR